MLRIKAAILRLLASLIFSGQLMAEEIHIAVASNFTWTMRVLAERFEQQNIHSVVFFRFHKERSRTLMSPLAPALPGLQA